MAHPEWALKHKQKNTEIRNIRGRYYLYKITSKWDPQKKRTKKVTLGMLGTLTKEEGFIAKGQRPRGRQPKATTRNVCVKEYGATKILQDMSSDIIQMLQAHFPEDWQALFILATNRLLYQAPLKSSAFLFEESFLSNQFTNVKLGKNDITNLLLRIGCARDRIVKFMRHFVQDTQHLLFDVTNVISNSKGIKLAQKGYNPNYEPQVHLLYMFNTEKREPNYYRIFPGNIQGTKALSLCLKESEAKDCIAIGDKGFCSEENLRLLKEAKISYILPLKRNSKLIDYSRLESRLYNKAFDGHFIFQGRVIFYTEIKKEQNNKIVLFTDKKLSLEEEQTYLNRIDLNYEGYDLDGYQKKQIEFGTIAMITNCAKMNPEQIYINYKSRMEIETVFDSFKNLLEADKTYMRSDTSMEAWLFLNHLAIMMYYRLFNIIKCAKLTKSISPYELLQKLARINKVKINSLWYTSEINSKTLNMASKLNLTVT